MPRMLTDAFLRNLTKTGKHSDGAGLYLELTQAGGRYWRLKYRVAGKEKKLALGVYPAVSLKEARHKADEARRQIKNGEDPSADRKAAKAKAKHEASNSFKAVSLEWSEHQAGKWTSETRQRNMSRLERDLYPVLGARAMASIQPGEVLAVIKQIEARGAGDQAGRALQSVKAIYRWALVHGRIEANPMLNLVPGEVLKPRQVQHRAALPERDLPEFLERLSAYKGNPHTRHAIQLLMLTAVRPGEVRGARWEEFDLEAGLWIIPAARMKARTEHRVPLSRQALDVLKSMSAYSGGRDLVFPSPVYPSRPLSENTLNLAIRRMGYQDSATAHGFRSLFSTVANESGLWSPDAIDRQLAHQERNQVRAAYHRSTYLKDRAKLMQWWADYLDSRKTTKQPGSSDA